MEKKLIELLKLTKLNVDRCPWCKGQRLEEYISYLKDEVRELEEALAKKDFSNFEEELGDVLWDTLIIAHLAESEGKMNGRNSIERILKKIANRKPWLLNGEKVTKEQASQIWIDAKAKEKAIKKNKIREN